MEVAIACLNTQNNRLLFSGANLSMTYIHNGVLNIINGGKCSVGSVQDSVIELPKTHTLDLVSGDCFYLYSDGYADQFGGEKGKKFKYKQLENLLKDNCQKSPTQQKEILNESFENWRANLEQVDDVTVIGMKI
jgi:serine phosphatase RsbU (regulator of sigma subunit)